VDDGRQPLQREIRSMRRPCDWLRAAASRLCPRQTMERLIDPVVADIQTEHAEAVRAGRWWRAALIRACGYVSFWKGVGLHILESVPRTLWSAVAADGAALGRIIAYASIRAACRHARLEPYLRRRAKPPLASGGRRDRARRVLGHSRPCDEESDVAAVLLGVGTEHRADSHRICPFGDPFGSGIGRAGRIAGSQNIGRARNAAASRTAPSSSTPRSMSDRIFSLLRYSDSSARRELA
jgi:hypothetical protein